MCIKKLILNHYLINFAFIKLRVIEMFFKIICLIDNNQLYYKITNEK